MQMAGDIATCMYLTGIDPFSGEELCTAKNLRDRKLQRALLRFFKSQWRFRLFRMRRGCCAGRVFALPKF
jgi:hypothetical protein